MAFYTRAQWGAAPPRGTGNALGNPQGVTVHWEGPKVGTRPHSQCAALVRSIQAFHQNVRGWSDIAYNLVGCEHGDVFEGRGASRGNAANGSTASNLSRYSMCALVGQGDPITDVLKGGILDGIAYLRRASGRSLPIIDCHSDHFATSCPGPDLRAWVKAGAHGDTPDPPASPSPAVFTSKRLDVDGALGPATMTALRIYLNRETPAAMTVHGGGWDVWTVKNLQTFLNKYGGARIAVDGDLGPNTARALQRYLKVTADGVIGPNTIRALQRFLNNHPGK